MKLSACVYDLEIVKGIVGKGEQPVPGIEYCAGWHDHANMGISVLGAYDYLEERYRVFCKDNMEEFLKLSTERKYLVTFNGLSFDNKVIAASIPNVKFIPSENDYDILVELWAAAGLGPKFAYPTHTGFGLDAVCLANFGTRKTGHGAKAPVDWQRGNIGDVIDYCLNDVALTKRAFDAILANGGLRDPRSPDRFLAMRKPVF